MKKSIQFRFDLPWEEFDTQLEEMLQKNVAQDNHIVLPVEYDPTNIIFILSMLDCRDCKAACCKRKNGGVVLLAKQEYRQLKKKYGDKDLQGNEVSAELKLPCRFLSHKAKCIIYSEQPLSCYMYPIEEGQIEQGEVYKTIALCSFCPESRRIARQIFRQMWKFKHHLGEVNITENREMLANARKAGLLEAEE